MNQDFENLFLMPNLLQGLFKAERPVQNRNRIFCMEYFEKLQMSLIEC